VTLVQVLIYLETVEKKLNRPILQDWNASHNRMSALGSEAYGKNCGLTNWIVYE
jgi:hypothetical protein